MPVPVKIWWMWMANLKWNPPGSSAWNQGMELQDCFFAANRNGDISSIKKLEIVVTVIKIIEIRIAGKGDCVVTQR